jgi:hypothetical protein
VWTPQAREPSFEGDPDQWVRRLCSRSIGLVRPIEFQKQRRQPSGAGVSVSTKT